MVFAQILNGIISNIIELDDTNLILQFTIGFDLCLQIDNLSTVPSIGWYYDGTNYWPPTILALIQSNTVISVIQSFDYFIPSLEETYQYVIDITTDNPQPMIGWTYNSSTFTPNLAYYQDLLAQAATFGLQLINTFAATNASLGITQAGMTGAVIAYTQNLYLAMTTGSLYEAITIINVMIADASETKTSLSPFITNDVLYYYLNEIQTWLEIPLTSNPGP